MRSSVQGLTLDTQYFRTQKQTWRRPNRLLMLLPFKEKTQTKRCFRMLTDSKKKLSELKQQSTNKLLRRCRKTLTIPWKESLSTRELRAPLCGNLFSLQDTATQLFRSGLQICSRANCSNTPVILCLTLGWVTFWIASLTRIQKARTKSKCTVRGWPSLKSHLTRSTSPKERNPQKTVLKNNTCTSTWRWSLQK